MLNNEVRLRGRLTREPELKFSAQGKAIAKFNLAVQRPPKKDEKAADCGADFIQVTCWGMTAEIVAKWLKKGSLVHVGGYIHTGSFEKDGVKRYTTDVYAENVDFLEKLDKGEKKTEVEDVFGIEDADVPF